MLQRSICSNCLKNSGMDLREVDSDEDGEFFSVRFENDWDKGMIACPPELVSLKHDDAFIHCPHRGAHEGAACVSFERES